MATVLIRRLDDATKARLRIRAAQHGRSMEEEAREILKQAVATLDVNQPNLSEAIRRRFKGIGGVELQELPREPVRNPPDFSE